MKTFYQFLEADFSSLKTGGRHASAIAHSAYDKVMDDGERDEDKEKYFLFLVGTAKKYSKYLSALIPRLRYMIDVFLGPAPYQDDFEGDYEAYRDRQRQWSKSYSIFSYLESGAQQLQQVMKHMIEFDDESKDNRINMMSYGLPWAQKDLENFYKQSVDDDANLGPEEKKLIKGTAENLKRILDWSITAVGRLHTAHPSAHQNSDSLEKEKGSPIAGYTPGEHDPISYKTY